MSTVAVEAACVCGSIGRTDLRQCPEHRRIWKGDKRLKGIKGIINETYVSFCPSCKWPMFSEHKPGCKVKESIENAKDRGIVVDRLFTEYVQGTLRTIPAGTRRDAVDLFHKARLWVDSHDFSDIKVQVLLGGDDHGGVCDFRFDGMSVDLKATYDLSPTHLLQVAAYHSIDEESDSGAILHVTERFKEPKLTRITPRDISDWQTMLNHWRMLKRRGAVA